MEAVKNEKQLFVRNLSYQTTGDDLTELFQEFGPLKHTSVVQENGVSKGFGFVKFSLEEDASTALEKLQGHVLHGRKIKLEIGVKKDRVKKDDVVVSVGQAPEQAVEAEKQPQVATKATSKVSAKDGDEVIAVSTNNDNEQKSTSDSTSEISIKRSRQILVFGIPVDINKKAFKMAVSKISKKAEVELIKEENELSQSLHIINPPGKIMMITAASRQEAAKVLTALDGAMVHSLEIRKHMPKDATPEAIAALKNNKKEKLVARTLADMTEVEYRKRKCRVILRNLSFQAVEQNVVDRMAKFGPLVSVEMPRTVIEKSNTNRHRKGNKSAQEGGEAVEGEGESPDKLADNQVLRPKGFAFVTYLCEKDAQEAVENSTGLRVCNREVAIDFCMSKESYEKYGSKASTTEEEAEEGAGVEEKAGDVEEEENDGNDEDGDASGGENADEAGDEEDEVAEEAEAVKEKQEDVQEGCTVFVRGLPFDAESADLKAALRGFGRIVMAVVVKDKLTGISKGSAFVKYSTADEAAACLAEASLNSGLTIKDRVCKVDAAVDRESAQKLKAEDRAGKDKRNLYLANEGLVVPKETAGGKAKVSEGMSEADKDKRQRAQNEKRKKLQNPLFFVSSTRLSVRNLGKDVTDGELKITCMKALKAALARGLVTPEDLDNQMKAQGSASAVTSTDIPPVVAKSCIRSAKVMLDLTRVRSGLPQSRGYGFVEFAHHAHALACLRELNNNAKYSNIASSIAPNGKGGEVTGSGAGRLIVEFSLENIQKVKILQEREARQKARNASISGGDDSKGKKEKKKAEKHADTTTAVAAKEGKKVEVMTKKSSKRKSDEAGSTQEEEKPATATNGKSDASSDSERPKKAQRVTADRAVSDNKQISTKTTTTAVSEPLTPVVAVAPSVPKPELTAEELAKKAEKRERQKKRKLEHKANNRAAREEAAAAAKAGSASESSSSTKKRRIEAAPAASDSKDTKPQKTNPKPAAVVTKSAAKPKGGAAGEKGDEEPKQQRPWGGHKRLRAMKNKVAGKK